MEVTGGVVIRPREAADLSGLVEIAEAVNRLDGYPPYFPDRDFVAFLVSDDALAAWVAEVDGRLGGHVALHGRSSKKVMEAAGTALSVPQDRLGVVARLLVAPDLRRAGIGRALLDTAAESCRARGLRPILDVGVALTKAVSLYDSAGWQRLGQVTVQFGGRFTFDEFIYAAPP